MNGERPTGKEGSSANRRTLRRVLCILGIVAVILAGLRIRWEVGMALRHTNRTTAAERDAFFAELKQSIEAYRDPDGWVAGVSVDEEDWRVTDYETEISLDDVVSIQVFMTDEYRKAEPVLQCRVCDQVMGDLNSIVEDAYDTAAYGVWQRACLKDRSISWYERKAVSCWKRTDVDVWCGDIEYNVLPTGDYSYYRTDKPLFIVRTPSWGGLYHEALYTISRNAEGEIRSLTAYTKPAKQTEPKQNKKPSYGPHEYSSGDDPFDPYNAKDYDNADDFADDWPYEFSDDEEEDYELAIEYWEEHH